MHEPIKIKQLINMLKNIKNQDKEVLINLSFNNYDILTIEEKGDNVTLYTKHVDCRNKVDNNDKSN